METALVPLMVTYPVASPARSIEPRNLFPSPPAEVALEIGFGAGEHLLWQMRSHPEWGFLGAEVFRNGLAGLLSQLTPAERNPELSRLRLWVEDARILLGLLADASLGRIFLLFPDPWPKRRHRERRLIAPGIVDEMARALRKQGVLRLATDDPVYLRHALFHILAHPDFNWTARQDVDWRPYSPARPTDWPETRYEHKARMAGREYWLLEFLRK